jgi:carboxyl-terminal processing protease
MSMLWRPAILLASANIIAVVLVLTNCAQMQPMPLDPAGRLFARGLDQIDELYIVKVSNRALAFDAAQRLSQLDPKLRVAELPAPGDQAETGGQTEIVLSYGRREVGAYPSPSGDDPHVWGGWLGRLGVDAKRASPTLAAKSQDEIDKALFDGIVGGLDRFSRYNTPQVARDQRAARDGFGGIGILLEDDADPFRITKVIPGSPADAVGIRDGDRLVAVDGQPTHNRSQNEVIRQLRGATASIVAVTVNRAGLGARRTFRLHRTLIVLPTVTVTRTTDVAVFHVSGFNQSTTQRLVTDLEEIKRKMGPQLRGIVLDLRGDPGGLLDQAVSLADVFIEKGPISATVGRNPASRQYFEASGDAVAPHVPIVVLINGGSASASEIVAAALQDAGRAVIVGSASYGKGTVQTVLRLPNDGELVLTWAELVAPAGYLLNGHGVVPTICTSGMGDDPRSLEAVLQRAGDAASAEVITATPRASLGEHDWAELRAACPPRRGDRAVDLAVAKRLLADPALYNQAVHMIGSAANLAARPLNSARTTSTGALTGFDGSLSSTEHFPLTVE